MRALVHRNVVRYLDRVVCRRRQLLFILMEYCDLGDLAGLIQTAHRHLGGIDPKRAADVAAQLLSALAYCHSGGKKGRALCCSLKLARPQAGFGKARVQNALFCLLVSQGLTE